MTVASILILNPLLITSHTLLRKRSDVQFFSATNDEANKDDDDQHDDQYVSTKILTKLLPSNNNNNSTSPSSSITSSAASPMACIPQENALKRCYENLPGSFNVVKCSQCLYGNVNPGTQIITCPRDNNGADGGGYCNSVAGCIEGTCPKDCEDEFYEVLNCIWEAAKCASAEGGGGGECVESQKKKAVATGPYPSRSGSSTDATVASTTTTATKTTTAATTSSTNPCSECSTSNGGVRNNFCGNLHTSPSQDDVCSSQTECKDHGLKCQVCTEIVMNDGYGGRSVVENVGSGAYICVKDDEEGSDNKAAEGRGGSSNAKKKKNPKQKGSTTAATATSSTGEKKQKGATKTATTTTTTTRSSTTPAATTGGGYCYSRAVVLGNCIASKDNTSPDCLNCVQAGTTTPKHHTSDPTCMQVKQHQFCANVAKCAHEHCGNCSFEFYAGLNCALQKISGCEQFSCAIGGGGIESAASSSSSASSGGQVVDDGGKYTLQQFQDGVERQFTLPRQEKEVVVIRES
jgi:hypothetical protein